MSTPADIAHTHEGVADRIAALAAELEGIEHTADPRKVAMKSRDRFAQSPVLREVLKGKTGDIYITPATKDELRTVVSACARHRVPITVRGAASGQFGQGVPLTGGAIIDVTEIAGIVSSRPGAVRALTGTIVADIDAAIRPTGWELRHHPSTARHATIGGYIAGGHAGIGSCQWGILRDRGNIKALEIMTVEEQPRLIELTGADVNTVHHAYGANGIITEVEMPTAPAYEWREVVLSFPTFADAVRFSVDICESDGVLKKVVSPHADPLPAYFTRLAPFIPQGHAMVLLMVAADNMANVADLAAQCHGEIRYDCAEGQGSYGAPLYEFTWGHSMLHYQRRNKKLIGLLALYPHADLYETIMAVAEDFADVGPIHLEMKRIDGGLSAQGSPVFEFEDQEQMAAMTRRLEAAGLAIANTHTPTLKSSGMKPWTDNESRFKREVDPYGLLAQGKSDDELEDDVHNSTVLPSSGWNYRLTDTSRLTTSGEQQ